MMAPSVLRSRDGGLIALGSGGSARIRTAVATVIAGFATVASTWPRRSPPAVHLDAPGHVQAEHGFTADDLAGLRQDFDVNGGTAPTSSSAVSTRCSGCRTGRCWRWPINVEAVPVAIVEP